MRESVEVDSITAEAKLRIHSIRSCHAPRHFHVLAVDKALTLQPNLGLAHCALGSVQLAADMDWKNAIAQFRRGLLLSPESSQSYGGFSWALAVSGKLHESIEQRQQFISREPLFAGNYFRLAELQIAVGQLDNAEKSMRIGMELQPEPTPHFQFTTIAIIRNDADAALQAARQPGGSNWKEFSTVLAMQIAKDKTAADAALTGILSHGDWAENQPYQMAQIYAVRSETDKALEWLKKTWARRDANIQNLLYDPFILRFRDDPRLAELCKEVGLPSPRDSEALNIDQIRALSVAKH